MLAGIRDILIITTLEDQALFQRLLKDGSQWGLNLSYEIQAKPEGLAQGFIIAEDFLNGAPSALILGDNIFFGNGLSEVLKVADSYPSGATVFGFQVANPERYGILGFDQKGAVTSIQEKPQTPLSNFAVAGLYFVDGTAPDRAKLVEPSTRGELEITSLLDGYLREQALRLEKMGRGYAWFDTGTQHSMLKQAILCVL